MPAEPAHRDGGQLVIRLVEPRSPAEQREEVEEDRGSIAHARKPRTSLAGSISYPDAHHVARGEADSPSIASSVARARFPSDAFHGLELLPVGFFLGAIEFGHGFGGKPERGVGEGGTVFEPLVEDRAYRYRVRKFFGINS